MILSIMQICVKFSLKSVISLENNDDDDDDGDFTIDSYH